MAKALAGEAGCEFISASGSEFEEMFVGLGAKRVRSLFEDARKHMPCIVFIDEIDAVGGKRNWKDANSIRQTLNELLAQMDGFEESMGILVVGATNLAESLDKALLRPGRFDRQLHVDLPDINGRMDILKLQFSKASIGKDIFEKIEEVARNTIGFSGADLSNLVNETVIKAASSNKGVAD